MLMALPLMAGEFVAPDGSFRFTVPAGWQARYTPAMTFVEPVGGGEGRIVVGSGIAMARSMEELTRQAAALAGQALPGARLTAAAKITGQKAEQSYGVGVLSAWNGMELQGEVYFAVLSMGRQERAAEWERLGRAILQSAKFQAPPRNTQAEQGVIGRWELSSYKSTRTGVRDSSSYSSNWTVVFLPGNRFRSTQQNHFDTTSETYGGGNVGASNVTAGTYRIFGATLVADIDGVGRQLFSYEPYSNGGLKLNGQLFLRQ